MSLRIRTIECDGCGELIFEGHPYIYDEYFESVFCDTQCHKDYYGEQFDRLFEVHTELYAQDMDEV